MSRRIMDVWARTSIEHARASAHGLDWVDEGAGVVDVNAIEEGPSAVRLELELDPTDLEHLEAHADTVRLSPAQARTLAEDLREAADAVEAAIGD